MVHYLQKASDNGRKRKCIVLFISGLILIPIRNGVMVMKTLRFSTQLILMPYKLLVQQRQGGLKELLLLPSTTTAFAYGQLKQQNIIFPRVLTKMAKVIF